MIRFLIARVVFTIHNTSLLSSIILLIQGQADFAARRFISASPAGISANFRRREPITFVILLFFEMKWKWFILRAALPDFWNALTHVPMIFILRMS
jgi:hypothetical protein